MNDRNDVLSIMFVTVLMAAFAFVMGMFAVVPNELENECIDYKGIIYCEKGDS